MNVKQVFLAGICAAALAGPAVAEDFTIIFDWAGLKSCSSGMPNTVPNPRFKVKGLPKGATGIKFGLTDLDMPGYRHGGGWISISADGTAPANAFRYKSPCPPSGIHTYEWSATAWTKKTGGVPIGEARARRKYPEE